MFSPVMKLVPGILLLISLVQAASSTSSASTSTANSSVDGSASSTSVDNSPEYTITALAAVASQNPCVFNCLIPIGLADSSGCDDVTENCACLSAPIEAVAFLTNCVATVCKSNTAAFAASATRLYESYCSSIYGSSSLSVAVAADVSADSAAAASSSQASVIALTATTTSAGVTDAATTKGSTSTSGSSSPSSTAKSDAKIWSPSWIIGTCALGGLGLMIVL